MSIVKKIKQHKYLKLVLNPYIIVCIAFIVWMLFFDDNSYLFHRELDALIEKKEEEIELYQSEIDEDKKTTKHLKNDDNLENFAREEYYMKRKDEEIYIIEYENDANEKTNE